MSKDATKTKKTTALNYDVKVWLFREAIQNILGESELELLHEKVSYDKFERKTDQSTHWHKKYYDNNGKFLRIYKEFVRDYVKKLYPEEEYIVYQKIPTFRVHLKNNLSVGEFHRDRDYSHGRNELNFHLPFTATNKSNSIWVESEEDKEDYQPQMLKYGQILLFDGANLKHGNKVNDSEETRVSVDFRVIPFSEYVDSDSESINTHIKFKIGGYFDKL
jgi:hypothetical protein